MFILSYAVPGTSVEEGMLLYLLLFSLFSHIPKTIAPWYSQMPCPGCMILNKGWKGEYLKWSTRDSNLKKVTFYIFTSLRPCARKSRSLEDLVIVHWHTVNNIVMSTVLSLHTMRVVLHHKGSKPSTWQFTHLFSFPIAGTSHLSIVYMLSNHNSSPFLAAIPIGCGVDVLHQ